MWVTGCCRMKGLSLSPGVCFGLFWDFFLMSFFFFLFFFPFFHFDWSITFLMIVSISCWHTDEPFCCDVDRHDQEKVCGKGCVMESTAWLYRKCRFIVDYLTGKYERCLLSENFPWLQISSLLDLFEACCKYQCCLHVYYYILCFTCFGCLSFETETVQDYFCFYFLIMFFFYLVIYLLTE